MIRRSGVRPLSCASKTARGMPRRDACGHNPSRQPAKLAAAWRMAPAPISGCPDDPDSPLHSGAAPGAPGVSGGAAVGAETEPVDPRPNSENGKPLVWAKADPASATRTKAGPNILNAEILSISLATIDFGLVLLWGTYMIAGPLTPEPPNPTLLRSFPAASAALSLQSRQPHETDSQSVIPSGGPWNPLPACHQGHAQGNAAGGRPADHPACGRRGKAGRHRALHLRHRAQQEHHRGSFRSSVRARNDAT